MSKIIEITPECQAQAREALERMDEISDKQLEDELSKRIGRPAVWALNKTLGDRWMRRMINQTLDRMAEGGVITIE